MYHYHPHVILYIIIIYLQLESYPIEKSHIWKRGGNIWSVILRRTVSSIVEVAPWRSIKRMSLLERGIKAYGVILVFSPYGLACARSDFLHMICLLSNSHAWTTFLCRTWQIISMRKKEYTNFIKILNQNGMIKEFEYILHLYY